VVKVTDLPEYERAHLLGKNLAPLGPLPWVRSKKPLSQQKIALITTAGLHVRDDDKFAFTDASYRVIPRELRGDDLLMSHTSVNFDRIGFAEDVNVVFPIDRFRELQESGAIGSLANNHYSFMGAGLLPDAYEASVRPLAEIMRNEEVDVAFLTPV
jgi:D-proline reductase (dithiol) PrdB